MENLFSLLYLPIPDTRVNETSKGDIIIDFGFGFLLVVSKNGECFVELAHLPVSLDQDANLDGDILQVVILTLEIKCAV
jgi:hypothetical protein